MKTTKQKDQSIEGIRLDEYKKQSRLIMVILALGFTVAGFVGGYFASVQVITDTQAKATVIVKDLNASKE